VKELDVEYRTHLAINWGCTEVINEGKNYDREAGQARSGINLLRGWIRLGKLKVRPIVTYPYRPPVASMLSDDAPLEVKRGDELPTVIREMT
jgi:hypothetical protein